MIDNTTSRGRTLRFLYDGEYDDFKKTLYSLGTTPVPKWVKSEKEITPKDAADYQTIFARYEGAVAAPAAGLHFSGHLPIAGLVQAQHVVEIQLHVVVARLRGSGDLLRQRADAEADSFYIFVRESAVRGSFVPAHLRQSPFSAASFSLSLR